MNLLKAFDPQISQIDADGAARYPTKRYRLAGEFLALAAAPLSLPNLRNLRNLRIEPRFF